MSKLDPIVHELNWVKHLADFMRPLNNALFYCVGDKVHHGLFKGMIVPEVTPWDDGNAGCKLLGCYEHELQPYFQQAIDRNPKAIVNIGCSEGYYAIGLARLMPNAVIVGFDVSNDSLKLCREFSEKNGVTDQILLKEGCRSPEEMPDWPADLYVVDCEGYELDLLDLEKCPQLVNSDIIVECHDFQIPNTTQRLTERLIHTHNVTVVQPIECPPFYPMIENWPAFLRLVVAIDKRPLNFNWLVCWSKAKNDQS